MRIRILGIGFCLTAVILLQGCYFWSSEISNPEITSSYRMDDFDYHDYVGYDESSQQEFILYIEKNYLNDLRAKIITENITLPSITLYEFTHRALAEKYKDPEFMETNRGKASKRDAEQLTLLVKKLLERLNLFQSVDVISENTNGSDLYVRPTIGVYYKSSSILGRAVYVTAVLTFGIISPAHGSEIVQLKFEIFPEHAKTDAVLVEGTGGGFTALSTVWMTDNPNCFDDMHHYAFGIAFRKLVLNILDKRNQIKKLSSSNVSGTD